MKSIITIEICTGIANFIYRYGTYVNNEFD